MKQIHHSSTCPLTELPSNKVDAGFMDLNLEYNGEVTYWFYSDLDNKCLIVSQELYNDHPYWKKNRREIEYLLYNEIWPKKNTVVDRNILDALITSSNIPITPLDKIDEILYYLKKHSDYLGEYFLFRENWNYSFKIMKKIGIVNDREFTTLINEALGKNWIIEEDENSADIRIALTLDGWERASNIGKISDSDICFIAMSFDSEMFQVYNDWIEPAITESKFIPYIVTDQHPDSDVTINDAILAGIKKARFTIADFTHHKAGVYFEAGYALGRGQKVIYTCREDEIGTAHFDTRNYQHLVWKDGADLKKKLMDKIEVFIKS
ncbi:hypothetical protein MM239_17030 [Belliella sp. DSM 111904]|uniref:Nucleoside 2-deoxyribosyltransferase n=1 Tax=Belliella filtrata TaxID=2923435 RepID=A0ABS9V3Y5_9BACT|nr:hypothetical protein [Belliella filtrata]MCH7411111.1 hypothetical protein [Belliella filtrata]